jgi:hypothetical protein
MTNNSFSTAHGIDAVAAAVGVTKQRILLRKLSYNGNGGAAGFIYKLPRRLDHRAGVVDAPSTGSTEQTSTSKVACFRELLPFLRG